MRRHHQLDAWKRGIQLVKEVYKTTAAFPKDELYSLTSQMRRCAVSVPSNIAEGAARSSKKEFAQFLTVARGSLSELETQIIIARQLGYMKEDEELDALLDRVFAMVGGLLRQAKQTI